MSFMSNAQLPPMSLKDDEHSMEAERDYKQGYSNMILIVKELQQQLAQYKVRCAGIDTFAVMLKEAKQESVTLARQKRALETAIANLQNRLSTNGLSSNVNMEVKEVYVPGTSKQTFDNLARENARLRSLLKSAEYQPGRKPSEELQEMKALVEDLESGKNQLQAQLQEVEGIKMSMVQQYEETIAALRENMAAERQTLEREVEKYQRHASEMLKNSDKDSSKSCVDMGKQSAASQTPRHQADMVDGLKNSLRHLREQCMKLDVELDNLDVSGLDKDAADGGVPKEEISGVTKAVYEETVEKLLEVTLMNQRWQAHNDAMERQHMETVAELKNEADACRNEVELKKAENIRLTQLIENLQRRVAQLRQQPQFDPSIVEILKQQIQVCTEDFNNERKDHEQAVKKSKLLQAEVDSVKAENEKVRQELERLKLRTVSPVFPPDSQLEPRQPQDRRPWLGPYFTAQQQPQALPQGDPMGGLPPIPNFPPVRYHNTPIASKTDNVTRVDAMPLQVPWAQSDSPFVFESEMGPAQMYALNDPHQFMSHSATDISPGAMAGSMASMPPLRRRCSDVDRLKDKAVMSCPKCSKKFPEDQTRALLQHIDECKVESLCD